MTRQPFRPEVVPDPSLRSPTAATQGEVLDATNFADLYRLAGEEGLPYFARLNAAGDVELYLVFESVDAFSEATRDAVSVEFKTYRDKLLAVIWTLHDPIQPLGFPLAFDIKRPEEHHMALRMLEQEQTLLHYLSYEAGLLTHIYTEAITFSPQEASRAKAMIRSLYEGRTEDVPSEAAVQEEAVQTISALELPDQVLEETGVAYLIDYARLRQKHGDEGAQHLLMSAVQQAVWVMRRHARSEVRETAFTVWAAEQGEQLRLIVTPSLSHVFEVVHMSADEANPFARFLLALPEFVRTEEAVPLEWGAYPLIRMENGRLFHLELDEAVQEKLQHLFASRWPAASNPYELR